MFYNIKAQQKYLRADKIFFFFFLKVNHAELWFYGIKNKCFSVFLTDKVKN